FFGAKVDISGNYAVVVARTMNGANAPTYPNGQTLLFNLGQSAVVLFELKNGQWQRMPNTLFRAGENDSGHYMSFGADVAISNNYLIVGEPFYPLENQIPVGAARPGRARIYSRNNNWSELTTPLTPINDTQNGFFGGSVDISDNYAIVGAQADNDGAGTVHIFNNENGQWNNEPIIDAPSGDIQAFGRSVAVSGDYVVIGAEGTAYIYNYEDDRWNLQSTLTPQFNTPEERQYLTSSFGRSVAISDEYVIVGASGSAFKYNIQGELQEILVAYDRNMTDNFGQAVDISNSNIIVSAMDEDEDVEGENTLDGAGAAYIFSTSELSSPTSDIQPTTTDEVSAQIKEFTPNSLISAINDNTAWGLDTDDRIYLIEDTGWKQPSTEARLRVVSAVDDDIAWGVNKNDIIYRTNDGGKKWNVGGRTARLSMVSAVDYNTAWGVNKEGKIYRTNNGGKNWNAGGGVAARLAVVSAIDYNTAWGVNKEGKIYRTNNGGTTWQLLTPNSRLVNISAVDYRTAWGVNKDGLIYRTNNGGGKWQGVSGKLKTISAVDYNTAWGVNETGKKYRTTDGGNTWQEVQ
ncbi:MAG: tectonin domain-containing protein, partial [Bacteroidota bacterium]